ncbi:MAG: wax ester/triacylglycerol synthase family O-acyltransferase [Mycobacterium sp.]|uniref:wax ester/triacylglycerol synthase family O-acyltransferase n=1 Tax=Mycobacterium sp. TaxID=1785 RepID=UPI003C5919BC
MKLMDPLDAVMMIGEVLSNPMHAAALLLMSPPEDAGPGYVDEVYREGLIAGKDLDPRLRRRAHRGLDTLGMWVWQDVDDVDVREHLQRRTLPKGSSEDALWRLVAELHAERLDRSKPLWMTYLIDGLPDGRFAYYVKVHHIVVDGVAGMRMISDALTTDPTQRSMKPFYAAGPHAPADRAGTGRAIPNPVSVLRSIGGTATSTIGFLRQVAGGEASYLAAGLAEGTTVLPLSAPFTRLNGRLGPQRAVAGGTWPKKRIKAVQEAAGVSGNDVLMAVVAGVLRSWLSGRDELPKRSLVAFCPITVRVSGDKSQAEHANLFGLELCPLGTDLENPAERLALIHRAMVWAKQQVASHGSGVTTLLAAPAIAPTALQSMIPFGPKRRTGYNVPISNVRGPQTDMYFNGAHLDALYPVSTVFDGLALNATMCSYVDQIAFGYVAGRDVVPDLESFIPLTERSLAELEAAVGAG